MLNQIIPKKTRITLLVAALLLVAASISNSISNSGIASAATANTQSRLLVFAAASMKNALEVIGRDYELICKCKIIFSFAGSGTLARQIMAGAPADLYISADMDWMEWLEDKSAILANSRKIIAQNRLVIAVAKNANLPASPLNIAALLDNKRIAMANPEYVPAGRYGKQALEKLQLWRTVSSQLVYGENVRVSLSLVARGDVGAAIVYFSDAQIEARVRVAYLFDKDDHQQIAYPAGLVKGNIAAGNIGGKFLQYLTSGNAREVFQDFGFLAFAQVGNKAGEIVGSND